MTKDIEHAFLTCQATCIALPLCVGGSWRHLLLTLSYFFGGAVIGSFIYGRHRGVEVTHG